MPIIKITQPFINNELHCPEGKVRIEYCDIDLPGLYVEVRKSSPGQGTYYLRYKDSKGKTCHQKISKTHEMTVRRQLTCPVGVNYLDRLNDM